MIHEVVYASPFDVVGWDGYSLRFSIHNFELGRVHQPPPVHQTFETSAFVICSLCQGCMITIQNQFPSLQS
jgi:homogentisate 1,2-dioxygenase